MSLFLRPKGSRTRPRGAGERGAHPVFFILPSATFTPKILKTHQPKIQNTAAKNFAKTPAVRCSEIVICKVSYSGRTHP